MVKLLLISDDFTGALDTGIQFAEYSKKTKILTTSEMEDLRLEQTDAEVLIVNTETRHLAPEEAYDIIYRLIRKAIDAKVQYIYKKTDSGLRGNVGSELAAALMASKEAFLPFIPAHPGMNRITVHGIHYVDGVPIHKSAFGADPFEPVTSPYVRDLFAGIPVDTVLLERTREYNTDFSGPVIGIFDAKDSNDFEHITKHLKKNNRLKVVAGCAGFAVAMQKLIGLHKMDITLPRLQKPLIVICGSLNPITKEQIEYGEKLGYTRLVLTPEQLLKERYFYSEEGERWYEELEPLLLTKQVVMIDSGISEPELMSEVMKEKGLDRNEARVIISRSLGSMLTRMYEKKLGFDKTVMIIGGDTLWGFVEQVNCTEITLVSEIVSGTVLSSVNIDNTLAWIISKSGGFGNKELIEEVYHRISQDD